MAAARTTDEARRFAAQCHADDVAKLQERIDQGEAKQSEYLAVDARRHADLVDEHFGFEGDDYRSIVWYAFYKAYQRAEGERHRAFHRDEYGELPW